MPESLTNKSNTAVFCSSSLMFWSSRRSRFVIWTSSDVIASPTTSHRSLMNFWTPKEKSCLVERRQWKSFSVCIPTVFQPSQGHVWTAPTLQCSDCWNTQLLIKLIDWRFISQKAKLWAATELWDTFRHAFINKILLPYILNCCTLLALLSLIVLCTLLFHVCRCRL